jgi:hypothetical protein
MVGTYISQDLLSQYFLFCKLVKWIFELDSGSEIPTSVVDKHLLTMNVPSPRTGRLYQLRV